MTKRMVIIDGKSVFYRGYYAMPGLSMADGTPTGGVYGFASLALEMMHELKPDYVAVAWDKPKTNIRKRLEIYPKYKAGRKPAPADFYAQIPVLHELLESFGWPLYELDDYEADDIIAGLDAQAEERGDIETFIISSDLDMLQILDKNTYLYALKRGFTDIDKFDIATFESKHGIRIDQFLDLKSLKGDSSDNIPGVPGVGEKTATDLLQKFDTLDGIYENLWQIKDSVRRKLEAGKESAYMSRELSRLFVDAPIELDLPAMDVSDLDVEKLKGLLHRLEFKSLIRRLPNHMRTLDDSVGALSYDAAEQMTASTAKMMLMMAPELVVYLDDETAWLSPEKSKVAKMTLAEAVPIISEARIVAHDTKIVMRALLTHGVDRLPVVEHDISQGSFLLNPLRKSRELVDLLDVEQIESPEYAISAIWALYGEHKKGFESFPKVAKIAYDIDFPLIPILARMEHRGIKLDVAALSMMEQGLSQEVSSIQAKMHEMVGYEFNIASPAQLAEVLFTKLQLPTAGIKKGKTAYSTGQKELDKLRGQHPIIELIEKFREYTKLQNTYVTALPKLVDGNNRLHTTFNQDVAATGRLSSTDPNLQNIPIRTELGRKIREAFVPEEGNVFVSADYSQFELRLAAVLAGDEKMINDFNAGTDIHSKIASDVFKVPLDDVTKNQRRAAKVVNFGVLYGMSPHGLATAADMSFTEAKAFIDEYFTTHSEIKNYIDKTVKQAHDEGFVETLYGRRRPTPDVKSSNFIVRSGAERAAANMPIQGTEADLMKMAMLEVERKLAQSDTAGPSEPTAHLVVQQTEKNGLLPAESRASLKPESSTNHPHVSPGHQETRQTEKNGLPPAESRGFLSPGEALGVQLLQIHDSILIECPKENAEQVSDLLKKTMENIAPDIGVRLQVDVTIGDNWGEV